MQDDERECWSLGTGLQGKQLKATAADKAHYCRLSGCGTEVVHGMANPFPDVSRPKFFYVGLSTSFSRHKGLKQQ